MRSPETLQAVWILVALNLAVAGFSAWLATQLDFFRTGMNAAQGLAGAVAATSVVTAVAFAWPAAAACGWVAVVLNGVALAAVAGVSLRMAWAGGEGANPMHFYGRHAAVAGGVFALNLGGLMFISHRAG